MGAVNKVGVQLLVVVVFLVLFAGVLEALNVPEMCVLLTDKFAELLCDQGRAI